MLSKELDTACKYFINTLSPDISKLHQLLYFTQGISFCMYDEDFFSEQIEAWAHGPMVPVLYNQRNPIICCKMPNINERQHAVLEYVKKTYGRYNGVYLENMTRAQDPWIYAHANSSKIILKEIISDFFIGLMFQPRTEAWTE